jgi:hypothetical protein
MNANTRKRTWLIACGFAVLAATLDAAEPIVVPVEGEVFAATLTSASHGKLEFTHGETKRPFEVADLVRYGDFIEPKRGPIWLLADGGALVAHIVELDKDNLRGESDLFGKISLPVSALAGVLVRPPGDKVKRDALTASVFEPQRETDRVVLDNGDEITGVIESISSDSIAVVAVGGRVEVELSRVAAVAFNSSLIVTPRIPPDRYLMLGFSDGSRLMTQSFAADLKEVAFTSFDTKFKSRASALSAIQEFGERTTYLSNLKELSFKHVPYLQLGWPLHKDANVLGQPLRVDGKRFLKGLGMHTAARVAYKLDGRYRQFQAELAIDDSAAGRGSAVCSVFVDDGSGKWQSKYTSPILRGGEAPVSVRIDLTDVKAISLLADFADHGDERDHVDWLNARLVRTH